jgi:hypothetical protein
MVDQVEEIHEQQHRPVKEVGSMSEENALIGLPHWQILVFACVEAQPLKSCLPSWALSIPLIFEIEEVLARDEEGNKEHQSFTGLPVQLHGRSVNDKEKHESEVSEMVQVLSSIDKEADQHERLDMLQDEEEELIER